MVIPGYSQFYNRDYWKLPIIYGGIGGLIYGGYRNNNKYMDTGNGDYLRNRDLCYIGAGLLYWASLLDGVVSYKSSKPHLPQRATIFSILLPGLGQAYNEHYWKIPIIYFGITFGAYLIDYNNAQYLRFRRAYNAMTDDDPGTVDEFNGAYTPDNLKYYRDSYRRDRDYSILFLSVFYIINAIDANVFAHLKQFDVSDNLSMQLRPAVIYNEVLAIRAEPPAFGMTLNLTFK
jgi:hypothetical protein